ncbi:hypothetical protein [Mycobacterium malmoense]|nr:hypothetical protein [Mycobacterium malmoense]
MSNSLALAVGLQAWRPDADAAARVGHRPPGSGATAFSSQSPVPATAG